MSGLKITFLGTGTSQGVPLINCDCAVCTSTDSRNKRLRTSITITNGDTFILIDTTPDMRQQLLRHPVPRIDAVLFTHAHADHIYGIDDLRRFNILQRKRIPVYGIKETLDRLRGLFEYAFGEGRLNLGVPNLQANEIDGKFSVNELNIEPIRLLHGRQVVLGFRIGDFAYCTDVSQIPENSYPKLEGLKILVLDALREEEHPTHFSLDEAISEAEKINAKETYFIHMSHEIDHESHSNKLPDHISFAYDGLTLELNRSDT